MNPGHSASRVSLAAALVVAWLASAAAYDQQLRSLADNLALRANNAGRKSMAVVDFTDLLGNATELGRFLAEELSVNLALSAKGFKVIDRTHLRAIIAENKLSADGLINPATARKLGQIAGVDTLVTGTLTAFGDSVRLSVKALDAATAEMISAAATDIPKTKVIEELLARGIGGVETRSSSTGTAAAPVTQASNRPAPAAGMQQSAQGFTISLLGCRRSGSSVTCTFTAVNTEADSNLNIDGRSFDDTGMEHRAFRYSFAGQENYNGGRTVAGVAVRFTINFSDVPGNATALPVVELEVSGRIFDRTKVQFRNVPLS